MEGRKLFSGFPTKTAAALTDKLHALVAGANAVITLKTLQKAILGDIPNGDYSNPTITIEDGKLKTVENGDAPNSLTTLVSAIVLGSIAPGSTVNSTVAFPGSAVNDVVLVGLPPTFPSGISVVAFVSSAGNVRLAATNATGSLISVPSLTYRLSILK